MDGAPVLLYCPKPKLLVIIVICNKKQTNWPYKQNYFQTSRHFYLPEFEFNKFLKNIFWRLYKCHNCIVTTIMAFVINKVS